VYIYIVGLQHQIHGTEGASYGSILTEKGAKALAITYKCLLLSEEVRGSPFSPLCFYFFTLTLYGGVKWVCQH
jgi:hypothetical protein